MPNYRKTILANDQIYHVFNRGVEKRDLFTSKREYARALATLKYYQFTNLPYKFSKFLVQPAEKKNQILEKYTTENNRLVEIIAYCLMPNHFHLLLKQVTDHGITKFLAKFTNSYTKYFNTKHKRVGPLVQGLFKSVWVEDDEQLIHLSRYIHLNPVASFVIPDQDLENYAWSSLAEYLHTQEGFCSKDLVLGNFSSLKDYQNFVKDQISYSKELDKIKHLMLE